MIKEALQFIAGLKEAAMEPKVLEINGRTYCNKELVRYDEEPQARMIEATTLTSLLDYIMHMNNELKSSMIIQVVSPSNVRFFSGLDKERKREYLFTADAIVPRFRFDEWYDQERFLIEMQANFEMNEDLATILKVAGNVEAKTTANYGDDGVSQKTTIKQGIASKADVLVPNPVTLIPYRTFLEVQQPASQFVFRIRDDRGNPVFKIVEAEGGLWRNEAMHNIKSYLEEHLSGHSVRQRITIIA
ncbi:hypothetical protein DXA96_14005 [Lachnospiraceae bacterium OF09-33XD]|jgi:hypothetical protein|nr:hypothetical protein DXA96_14005 [Lachnospiraceae bacterium OF09-33XD]